MRSSRKVSANRAASSKTAPSAMPRIDPVLTKALADASLAAYNDFERLPYKSPTGYAFLCRFTGWDDWFWDFGQEERFGLIFKSRTGNRFIVAFRGTDSDSDALEDAFFEYTTFKPYRNSVSPTPDDVSAGFNGIYSTKGGTMTQTMQQQIFGILQSQQLSEVYITGHSLGGGLSQLFTLDMRVSLPHVNIQTINFASPRVGGSDWGSACSKAGAAQKITRVINYWDYVPDLPITIDIFDQYVSVGTEFRTSFYGGSSFFDELHRHRLLNLMVVLRHCLPLNPQIWVGTFYDAVDKNYLMYSTTPPGTAKVEMLAKLREVNSLERSVRAANSLPEPSMTSARAAGTSARTARPSGKKSAPATKRRK